MGREDEQRLDFHELLDRLERQAERIGELESENRMLRGESMQARAAVSFTMTYPQALVVGMSSDGRRPVRPPYAETKRAEDAWSILRDLVFANEAVQRLRGLTENPHAETVRRALWTSALVSYVRCFADGRRFRLTEEIFEEHEGAVALHRFIKDIRNKHIAHSVNPFEQTRGGLSLPTETASEEKADDPPFPFPVMFGGGLVSWTDEGLASFQSCIGIAGRHMEGELNAAMQALRARALEDDAERLRTYPELRMSAPSPEEAGRARDD